MIHELHFCFEMRHGLYYRFDYGFDSSTEMEDIVEICKRKNIKYNMLNIREKVIEYYMKQIASFIERHYVSKKSEEDQKPFVRYNFQCGICYETHTTFNLCNVCKFSMCINCMKRLQTPHCVYCRKQCILHEVSYIKTKRVFREMFGDDFNFILCINLYDMMFDVVSKNDYIVLKDEYNCYCYMDQNKEPDYFMILKNKITGTIRNVDIVEQLLKQGYDRECSHYYFEGCSSKHRKLNNEHEISWGS